MKAKKHVAGSLILNDVPTKCMNKADSGAP